jgi:rhodanese-related sulfurtransferase
MRLSGKSLLCLFLLILGLTGPVSALPDPLPVIDNQLRRDFPEIESINAADLQILLEREPGPILLDIREADEYAVSHLKGALRIGPDAELRDVLRATGPDLKGRTIIVYCSVGVRSTELAARLREGLKAHGAARIANLSQGIFGWHNTKRPLVRSGQLTPYVHPYDRLWGRLVKRQELARYSPLPSAPAPALGMGLGPILMMLSAIAVLLGTFLMVRRSRLRQKA